MFSFTRLTLGDVWGPGAVQLTVEMLSTTPNESRFTGDTDSAVISDSMSRCVTIDDFNDWTFDI